MIIVLVGVIHQPNIVFHPKHHLHVRLWSEKGEGNLSIIYPPLSNQSTTLKNQPTIMQQFFPHISSRLQPIVDLIFLVMDDTNQVYVFLYFLTTKFFSESISTSVQVSEKRAQIIDSHLVKVYHGSHWVLELKFDTTILTIQASFSTPQAL